MGWNDHVEFVEVECQTCGVVDTWEFWSDVGKGRYVGAVGKLVGQDATKSGKCPHCGSTDGRELDDDKD